MVFEGRFIGKVAIVTGGYQGIGASISRRFVAEGGKVFLSGRSREKLDQFIASENNENIRGCVCDVADEESVKNMIAACISEYGKIDVVFSNAGVIRRNAFMDMPISDLDDCYNTNVRGTALVCQYAAKEMISRDIKGSIVCTASTNSMLASPGQPAYGMSKGAVNLLTKCMALDLSDYGIRVNCFGPAPTVTPMTAVTSANPEKVKMFTSGMDIHRFSEPEEMAAVALFLASDDASFMTGAFVPADGGATSRL